MLPEDRIGNGQEIKEVDRIRAYLEGVEIDQVPELKEVCAGDDWMTALVTWAAKNRPNLKLNAIFVGEAQDLLLSELWIGQIPPFRAQQMGGILKTFDFGKLASSLDMLS